MSSGSFPFILLHRPLLACNFITKSISKNLLELVKLYFSGAVLKRFLCFCFILMQLIFYQLLGNSFAIRTDKNFTAKDLDLCNFLPRQLDVLRFLTGKGENKLLF